jgi:hypothetical protein
VIISVFHICECRKSYSRQVASHEIGLLELQPDHEVFLQLPVTYSFSKPVRPIETAVLCSNMRCRYLRRVRRTYKRYAREI